MSLSRSEGESYAKSQVGSATEEGSELDRRAELRRQWATLREEWSDFLSQRQSEQDAFVEKLLQQVPLSISSGIETRNSSELPSISKAFLSPAHISHLSSSTPEMTVLPSSRQALPNPTFRSEKMLMSDADLAAEAECRMKQFVEEEESMTVSRKTSVRRSSRNHSSISEDDDKLHSVREFAERTSALENLVSTMRSNKRLHHWFNRLPCGKRFLRYFVNSLDYLNSLEEPERRGCCHCILQSTWFCSFCTLTILANVGVILYSANWTMENETFSVPSVVTALDIFFCCVYFVESGLKLIVHRAYFFWNEDAGWNVFDLCLVVLAVYDQAMFFVWQSEEADMYNANMNFMRSLRIVKVSRILRLVRVIRIFRDLRCMLFSILWSFIPLFWCLVLIFFVILVFSLFLIQLATEFVIQANWADLPWGFKDEFLDYFGSVQDTMATLYMSSTGGVDWRVPYEVLAASGDLSCAAFLAYIAFFEFAVFNVLTGWYTFALRAVQALASSLRSSGTKHLPMLVLHTEQVSSNTLARLSRDSSLTLRAVETIPNPHSTSVPGWVNSGFTKLRVWEQDDFAKLVYIDADCLVLENVDEFFDRSCPAFCPDVFPPDKFNAGVMVLEPSRKIFQEMLTQVEQMPSHDGGDTGFLNSFFPDWYSWPAEQRLPFRYNALRTMYWFTHSNPGYWKSVAPVKVLHFCSSPKPWDSDAKKGDLEQIWWEHYLGSQIPF